MKVRNMNSFTLSDFGLPKRIPRRAIELRQDNFDELYDYDTLFYDIIYSDERLIFIGPTLPPDVVTSVLSNCYVNKS